MIALEEVHIYFFHLGIPKSKIEQYEKLLNQRERRRAGQLNRLRHRERFIAAHGILRSVLGDYINVLPENIDFTIDGNGKPSLFESQNMAGIYFNLSHSQDAALIGIGKNRLIGVDIEYMRPSVDIFAIAKRYFSPDETAYILHLPKTERYRSFFTFWTMKEACIKATGQGFRQMSKTLICPDKFPSGNFTKATHTDESGSVWSVQTIPVFIGYMAAVAVKGHMPLVKQL